MNQPYYVIKSKRILPKLTSAKEGTSSQMRQIDQRKLGEIFFSQEERKNEPCSFIEYDYVNGPTREKEHKKTKLSREYIDELTELLSHKEAEYFKKRKLLNEEYSKQSRSPKKAFEDNPETCNILPPYQLIDKTTDDSIEESSNFQSELSSDNQKALWTQLRRHIAPSVKKKLSNKKSKLKVHLTSLTTSNNIDDNYLPSLFNIGTVFKSSALISNLKSHKTDNTKSRSQSTNAFLLPSPMRKKLPKEKEIALMKQAATKKYKRNNKLMKAISSHLQELEELKQRCRIHHTENR